MDKSLFGSNTEGYPQFLCSCQSLYYT